MSFLSKEDSFSEGGWILSIERGTYYILKLLDKFIGGRAGVLKCLKMVDGNEDEIFDDFSMMIGVEGL